ncbi:SDR family NAD(P)-dependent oxidoreductase [Fodinisporobacter ferrooxydans]|uniref:SDR family NAD(P)-dependent oxidoreductase n=1 Tax=Fodinisporobacter ferrooxydans TaxID=2901836 RepID=A0ABY4CKA5_9BACL|nr:SDR family NAD(P)-dependent oxidoreductase [Alicyclobacillaceae bacterium MYW30-H2]
MVTFDLQDKVALITGSTNFWGEGIGLSLARAGAEVWLHHFEGNEAAERLCQTIQSAGGQAHLISGDLTKPEEVTRVINFIIQHSGSIDILINNAEEHDFKSLKELEPDAWVAMFDMNLDVPFLCCKEVFPHMVRAGKGYVVNITSAAAVTGEMGPHFAASKSALNSMTRALSREYKPKGIRIISLAPSVVQLELERGQWKEKQKMVKNAVANMVLVACSPYGEHISCEPIMLDGGESIG